jgi:hypothetical protein
LLGTYFRQLPTNERKCLDVIPVDMVCRGMTLIAAAIIARRHEPIYQLSTSASNPCDMGRSIELTGLAHRKHYRSQQSLENWIRMQFDTIPVSKTRYEKFSVPAQKAVVQGINRAASALQMKKPPLARAERDLIRVWWDYWINIHIPALRRWVYPLIEGRPMEQRPHRAFSLRQGGNGTEHPEDHPHAGAASSAGNQN